MSLDLVIAAIVLAGASGLPGLLLSRTSVRGQWLATVLMTAAAAAGLVGAGLGLLTHPDTSVVFPWQAAGNALLGVDVLSAFFLVPIFLMGGLGSVYSLGYWPQRRYQRNGKKFHVFWGLLVAGLGILVTAKHAMAFLFGWEVMALSAFFLISIEDHRSECRRAGLIYLMATHIGTLTLFGLFVLWRWSTGSYVLQTATGHGMTLAVMNGLFFLGLIAFGLKAGIMPLHFWLPGAHANAPSPVSAILSGVVLKMGIYGLLRLLLLLPMPPVFWGGLILLLGAASGLLGVVFAIGQHDLKRLLAYHSVENIGIILMGMGLATLGRSAGRPEWIVLGMAGCLLHVWNHSFFKSLLFFGAGSVVHATGTREIDRLGGLGKGMPWTAGMFLVGAVAICGLPPLNGFVSELFVYLGLIRSGIDPAGGSAAVMAAPVLAMIGALAVACFVKVYGAVFLGIARTSASGFAHESPLSMRIPMVVLAVVCGLIGLAPWWVSPILDQVIAPWLPATGAASLKLSSLVPLKMISGLTTLLLAFIGGLWLLLPLVGRARREAGTWDCGYAQPTSRMQYTAASFAQTIVVLFHWVLRPRTHQARVEGLFPKSAAMQSHVDDAILDRVLLPSVHGLEHWFGWFHRFQRGFTQYYILYILITVILMLSTLLPFKEIFALLL